MGVGLGVNTLGRDVLRVRRVVLMLMLIRWIHVADPRPVGRGLSKVVVSHDNEDECVLWLAKSKWVLRRW